MRDDDVMLVDMIEGEKNAIDAIVKGKGKSKSDKIKGKGKGKTPGKMSTPTPSTASVRAIEGWCMRPCNHCGGKHMDVSCPTRRTAPQAAPTTAGRSPKAAGKGAKGAGKPA
eukprot:1251362-Heterocapsa_arctica.AAC.2